MLPFRVVAAFGTVPCEEAALSAYGPGGPPKSMKNRGGLLRCRRRGKVKAHLALWIS